MKKEHMGLKDEAGKMPLKEIDCNVAKSVKKYLLRMESQLVSLDYSFVSHNFHPRDETHLPKPET